MIDDIDKILRPDADDNIDEDLKREGLFCVWKGADKEPFDPRTGKHACVNDPNTFTTFQEAKTAYNSDGEWDGIGMLNQGGYGFIDVDGCVENGEVNEYARGIITLVHGYTEFSPSGTGVRIVFWIDVKNQTCAGGKPWAEGKEVYDKYHYQKNPSNHTEAYFPMYTNRYATITGHVVPGCEGWKARGVNFENLRTFLNQYMKRPVSEDTEQGHARDIENNPQPVDDIPDTELVDKIRDSSQGEKFSLLYDTPVDPDATGESEGDQALADILCWWTCHDRNRIEKLMFQSQRVRDKWEKRQDYIDNTIRKALQKISDFEGFMYEGEGGIDLEGAIKSFYEATDKSVDAPQNVSTPQGVNIDIIPAEQPPKLVPIDYSKYTASNIEVKLPEFLFYPYIPRGYFTILSASPGVGKTYFSCWLSAMITKGVPINDRSVIKSKKVLYCSMEDGAQDTLVPRFRACGGVDENFIILDTSAEINPTSFSDPMIKRFIQDLSPDLIIFDAVTSYIGTANMNHANEVRNALKPLIKLIEGTGTAVLLIAHNNKMSSDGSAQNRISGSVDFSAVVRSGINVGRNPDNKDNLAVGHFKSNFTKLGPTLEFEYQNSEFRDIPAIKLIGELEDVSADDLVNSTKPERAGSGGRPNEREEVKPIIAETLKRFGGWGPATFIKNQVKEEVTVSVRSIERAFKEMVDVGEAFQDMERDEFGVIKGSYWRYWSVDELPENPGKAWNEKFEKQETIENVITFPA